tara:strand:- start:629 stop:748 length:120 start_codon:yes stop_codon:yes gene_type:complete
MALAKCVEEKIGLDVTMILKKQVESFATNVVVGLMALQS